MKEQNIFNPEVDKQEQSVVRALLVSLASAKGIYKTLEIGEEDPSILRFYTPIKGTETDPRFTFFGGKINKEENLEEGIYREINEETAIQSLGIPKLTSIGSWKYKSSQSGSREVFLTYTPILPPNNMIIGDPKISAIKQLSLKQLKELVRTSSLDNIPIEGHLSTCENPIDQVIIDEENKTKRNIAIEKGLSWMGNIESQLLKELKQVAFKNQEIITEKEFIVEYEKILSSFMKEGLNSSSKKRKPLEKESMDQKNELIKVLNSGYLGKDLLYYLPKLAQHGFDWNGVEQATEGVQIFTQFLNQVFNDFCQKQNLTETQYQEQLNNPNLTLESRLNLINQLNESFCTQLKKTFKVSDQDLAQALIISQEYFRNLLNDMKIADSNLTKGLYQDFTLLNEVNNANYGTLLSLFLGFDTKVNRPEFSNLIRFEAGRQLILLFKTLSSIKYYQEEVNKVINGRLSTAINNFFGYIDTETIVELDKNKNLRMRKRIANNNKTYYIDEKPVIKSTISFLRKTFEERYEDIHDLLSISVVYPQESQPTESQIKRSNSQLIDSIKQFLHKEFPGSRISTDDERSYGTDKYVKWSTGESDQVNVNGKRKGSQSNLFVRTKLYLTLDDETLELGIYPRLTITEPNCPFKGWKERMNDDDDYAIRRVLAGENGMPSFYDLLFPPEFYPHHYYQRLCSSYHK